MVAVGRARNMAMSSRLIREGPSSPVGSTCFIYCHYIEVILRGNYVAGWADACRSIKGQTGCRLPGLTKGHWFPADSFQGRQKRRRRGGLSQG